MQNGGHHVGEDSNPQDSGESASRHEIASVPFWIDLDRILEGDHGDDLMTWCNIICERAWMCLFCE